MLEGILRQVPVDALPFTQPGGPGYASLAHSSLACKATWAAYNRFAACFALEWRIENITGLGTGEIVSPSSITKLGRVWTIKVYPKGSGAGAMTHVSIFLQSSSVWRTKSSLAPATCVVKMEFRMGTHNFYRNPVSNFSYPAEIATGFGYPTAAPLSEITRISTILKAPASGAFFIKVWVHGIIEMYEV